MIEGIQAVLTDDLRRKPWKGSPNPMAGHCYVASEALYHLLGGPNSDWKPEFVSHEGSPHWYLRNRVTDEVMDVTSTQFDTPVPYHLGRGKGFLTKQPSKRAQVVIDRYRRSSSCPPSLPLPLPSGS